MIDRRSEPEWRTVVEDAAVEAGGDIRWLGRLIPSAAAAAAADAATAVAADAATTTADDAAATTTADDAAAVADDDAVAVADDDAVDAADAADAATAADFVRAANRFFQGDDMREGLVLVVLPGRYWSVTRVGWARRAAGDEWELHGAVTVTRAGSPVSLDVMAATGLPSAHAATPPARTPELLHRLTVRRVLVADEEAWLKHCPRPAEWAGEVRR